MNSKSNLRLVVKNTCGMIFIPKSITEFHKKDIEPLIIAVIRGGGTNLVSHLEALQEEFEGNLEIFSGASEGDLIVTMPYKMKDTERLRHRLESLTGGSVLRLSTEPEDMERVSRKELRSSLRA